MLLNKEYSTAQSLNILLTKTWIISGVYETVDIKRCHRAIIVQSYQLHESESYELCESH